jgi:hypothetical protein
MTTGGRPGLSSSPEQGFRSQQMKQVRGGLQAIDQHRLIEPRERAVSPMRDRDLLEGMVLIQDVDVLPGRRPVLRDADPRRTQPEHGEPVGIGVWKRLEQERVGDAENGGVGADTEGEREHNRSSQSGAFPESSQSVTQISQNLVHSIYYDILNERSCVPE